MPAIICRQPGTRRTDAVPLASSGAPQARRADQPLREGRLADAGWTGEEQGVRQPLVVEQAGEAIPDRLVTAQRRPAHRGFPAGCRSVGAGARQERMAASTCSCTATSVSVASMTHQRPGSSGRLGVEAAAHALVEGFQLGVEAVVAAGALQTDAHRTIEQDGEVWPQPVARPGVGARYGVEVEAAPVALIGDGRGREAVGEHQRAGRQRRFDHLADVLGAVGEIEKQLGQRMRRVAAVQEELAQRLPERGSARLDGDLDAVAVAPQRLRGAVDLGRLAGALGALERDQAAG